MRALVVVESAFGNTAAVAGAIADGLQARGAEVLVVPAHEAPSPEGFDLVAVGAPTHNLGLPSPASRESAAARGAVAPPSGVREWLASHPSLAGTRTVAFDTRLRTMFAGSAAKKIASGLRRCGSHPESVEQFIVAGEPATLTDGELDRARDWGASLCRG